MKKLLLLVLILISMLSISSVAFADSVSIPEEMLTEEQKAQLAQQDLEQKVEQYGQWVGLGEEIGKAVDSSLSALTDNAEKFANTKVGIFTMFLIAYKVIGVDLIQLAIGVPLLAFMLILWTISYYRSCVPHRIVISSEGPLWNKKKNYKDIGEDKTYGGAQRWAYAFILAAIIAISAMVIFL